MSKRIVILQIHRENFERKYKTVKDKLDELNQKVKIYIDTNIFSRSTDYRLKEADAKALSRIVKSRKDVELYTSEKTREEISRHGGEAEKNYIEFIMEIFGVIPEENFIHHYSGAFGSAPLGAAPLGGGGSREDPIYRTLRGIFEIDDAQHIFQAIKSGAKYFLTLDKKTILSRRTDFNQLGYPLKIVSPMDLEKILFAEEDNTQ